ncbi:mannan endo-1,4-beta-mannosidase 5-like [Diospyros lotus]|uniref:mannan endo-1,4-beta-mannosidase 5-like n=1 Tax=Diospyros lotus TaxID=55363 RepID=UPI0022567F30|nr:mannan endo-1,4-beta-mannosidase 5-like [Diospyros lotus]
MARVVSGVGYGLGSVGIILLILLALVCEAMEVPTNYGGLVTTKGTHFLLDGSPFYFNGFNSYWMMHVAAQPTERDKVTQVFREAAGAGLTVCRTWAFSDGGDEALQISPGVYNEYVFQALDFVIYEARKYGIRLILSFVNNYSDFGGRAQYVKWARDAGIQINSDDDFYTHSILKKYYKNHVKRVITRCNTITGTLYKDDPTIMAWELINEPRCQIDYSGRTIYAWVQEMAAYVKSLDNKHLLEVGMEGFYGDSTPDREQVNPGYQVGTDFITNNIISEIDFTTIHAYPDTWLSGKDDDSQMAFMNKWVESHWADSKRLLRKPMIIAEFGKSSKDPKYSTNKRDSFMRTVYEMIDKLVKSGGTIGGSLVWQLMAAGMEPYHDGYEIILSENLSTNEVISMQSSQMAGLSHLVMKAATEDTGADRDRDRDIR